MANPNYYEIPNLVDHRPKIRPNAVKDTFNDFSPNTFTILHINMRSLVHKMHLFEVLLAQLDVKFSCIIISETWFSSNEYYEKYFLDGYNLFCSSRPSGGGGGIYAYVSDEYEDSVTDIRLTGSEAMVVCINRSGRPVYSVFAVYHTPSGVPSAFLADLDAFLPALPSNSIVVGDLNFDLNPENDTDNPTLDYMRTMSLNGYFNIIESATRFGATKTRLIDHIFVKNLGRDIRSCTVDTNLLADHLPIIGCIALPGHKNSNNHECTRTITKLDRDQLYGKINDPENWLKVLACDDPDQAFTKFTNSMQAFIAESSCTQVKSRAKSVNSKSPG